MGRAKLLEDFPPPHEMFYFVIRITIQEIQKNTSHPVVSFKPKNGNVKYFDFHNQPPGDLEFVVDKITLRDWIDLCGIRYRFIEGVYWDEGGQDKIGVFARKIHELRQEYKRLKNPMHTIPKLIGNTMYGRLGISKADNKYVILHETKVDNYISKRWQIVKGYIQVGEHCMVAIQYFDTSVARTHCAAMILSMSKRILREVTHCVCLINHPIYMIDTDSIHIDAEIIDALARKYREMYGKEIIGKDLGQFHSDFKSNCNHSEESLIATSTIILAPKAYMDHTKCGKENDHVKLKGIPRFCINSKARELNMSYKELYLHMVCNPVSFVLNPRGHCKFQTRINGAKTIEEGTFIRKLFF